MVSHFQQTSCHWVTGNGESFKGNVYEELMAVYSAVKDWLYRGHRPNWLARILNGGWAIVHAWGIAPNWLATLDVIGRKSGRIVSLPVVIAHFNGERYLASMLGDDVQWVRNVRAANGKAYLRNGQRQEVRLVEIPADKRAPILKAYL